MALLANHGIVVGSHHWVANKQDLELRLLLPNGHPRKLNHKRSKLLPVVSHPGSNSREDLDRVLLLWHLMHSQVAMEWITIRRLCVPQVQLDRTPARQAWYA